MTPSFSPFGRLARRSFLARLALAAPAAQAPVLLAAMAGGPPAALALALLAGVALAVALMARVLAPLVAAEAELAQVVDLPPEDQGGDLAGRLAARAMALRHRRDRRLQGAEAMADRDPLTGLLNRRGLDRALRGIPRGAVLALDLDHFKAINDRFGHAEGDRVLLGLAELLAGTLRRADVAARTGGEEFVVILPGLGLERARQVAERLRMAVEDRLPAGGTRLTVSVGVAADLEGAAPWDRLLGQADEALYRAKERGRNRVELSARDPPQGAGLVR
jgi:diguanylate cyclase (GGDEF)-like protein